MKKFNTLGSLLLDVYHLRKKVTRNLLLKHVKVVLHVISEEYTESQLP